MVGANGLDGIWERIERAEMVELKELKTAYGELQRLPLNRKPSDAISLSKEDATHIAQAISFVTAAKVLTEKVKRSTVGVFNTLETAMNQINDDLKAAKAHLDTGRGLADMFEGLLLAEKAANKLKGVILAVWSILALEGQVRK